VEVGRSVGRSGGRGLGRWGVAGGGGGGVSDGRECVGGSLRVGMFAFLASAPLGTFTRECFHVSVHNVQYSSSDLVLFCRRSGQG
jgi:hypothetical protein